MVDCPTYVVPEGFQLQPGAGPTGPFDCTAWAARNAIAHATCGRTLTTGRFIREHSNEPRPDPRSPGLNLPQVAAVALRIGVYLDVRIGSRAVTWTQYENRRKAGQGAIIQVDYGPIADSNYDAGRGFRGGHAMFETVHATYDSLADGRAPGVFRHNDRVYDRPMMRSAAGRLWTGTRRVGTPYVWAAFTRDVIPDFKCQIVPGDTFWRYYVEDGIITGRTRVSGRSFSARCTVPLSRLWPESKGGPNRRYTLVRVIGGAYHDWYIHRDYAQEI